MSITATFKWHPLIHKKDLDLEVKEGAMKDWRHVGVGEWRYPLRSWIGMHLGGI